MVPMSFIYAKLFLRFDCLLLMIYWRTGPSCSKAMLTKKKPRYPLDSDLSGGLRYPASERLGPEV